MNEIILKWREFIKWWWKEGAKIVVDADGNQRQFKPDFFDFMEWLSKDSAPKQPIE